MIQRTYFSHYRAIRAAVVNALTVGTAFLVGYFILWARL
jgi:hypothetical protein